MIFSLYKDLDKDLVVYLSHDLSMLRLVETFSESAPQLVFMLTIILRRGQFDPVTGAEKINSQGIQNYRCGILNATAELFNPLEDLIEPKFRTQVMLKSDH